MIASTPPPVLGDKLFSFARTLLGAIVWSSALIFGLYILVFYALAYVSGDTAQWNKVLPGLYDAKNAGSTAGIAVHFLAGGIILVLGCLQLLPSVRNRYPLVHRLSGRVYVVACLLAAIGGLLFIALKGTIGGTVMDIGFTGYGVLMFLAAVQTIKFARGKDFKRHRAWALRLFALAIGSWLYRMDYGFYLGFGGEAGHTEDFTGWFDYFMAFWFYLPNLVVVEIILAEYPFFQRPGVKLAGGITLLLTSAFLLFASYFFIKDYWGPGILGGL
ncbi:MAG: putative membrane protein [Neolewinella sp.]|jgi:uncharacterized membrane protein